MTYSKKVMFAGIVSIMTLLVSCKKDQTSAPGTSSLNATNASATSESLSYDCLSNFKYLEQVFLVRRATNTASGRLSRLEVLKAFSSVDSCAKALKSNDLSSSSPEKLYTDVSKECYFSRTKEDDKRGLLVYEIRDSHSNKVLDLALLAELPSVANCDILRP